MPQVRGRILISGIVQGVYFRAYAREEAQRQRVSGWVRNRADGRVETVVEGKESAVLAFIAWCHHGPPSAHVTDVQVMWEPYEGEFHAFMIRG